MTKKAVVFSDSRRKTYEKIIKEQTQEKKRELHRAIDGQVDKQIDKKYILFLKDLKIMKVLDKHKKTCEDLDVFERNLENKKKQLERGFLQIDKNFQKSQKLYIFYILNSSHLGQPVYTPSTKKKHSPGKML